MKKIIVKVAICLTGVFVLSSCTDFLDENPTTMLSETSAYSTEETLEAQTIGCYQSLYYNGLWFGNMYEFLMPASGLVIWKGQRTTNEWLDCLKFAKYSSTNYGNGGTWTSVFLGINRCNRLLDNLPDSPVDEDFKTEVEAEIKLLRALLYFTAVRLWGDVPLYTTSPKSIEDVHGERVHFAKVYRQVLEDLTFAETYMRDPVRAEKVAPDKGRPNKWAATAMKASVYITIASLLNSPDDNFWDNSKPGRTPDFTECGISTAADAFHLAYETAVNVIENGPYRLSSDYRTLFRWTEPDDWRLPERIFVLASTPKSGNNYITIRMNPQTPENGASPGITNNNFGRVRPSRWLTDNIIKYSGGEKGTGTMNSNLYCTTADPRYEASFFSSNRGTAFYPANNCISSTNISIYVSYWKKYVDPTYNGDNGRSDFYLMRFAEMYLIAAEAAASLSSGLGDDWSAKAMANVNVLRKRARCSNDTGVEGEIPADFTAAGFESLEELKDAIFWERLIELSGEGHEWFDTHRFGAKWLSEKIAEPQNEFLEMTEHYSYWVYTYNNPQEREGTFPTDVQSLRKSLVNALPQAELVYNNSINEQNDFYWE